jgi:hypothetical protein
MLTILVFLIGTATILVLILLAIVVVGIRREPPNEQLSEQASSLIALFVRGILGLHVRKPGLPSNVNQGNERSCPGHMAPLEDPDARAESK